MKQHIDLMRQVYTHGTRVKGRNGWTKELFGGCTYYPDVANNFPICTTKAMPFKTMVAEMLCFIRGYNDVRDFQKMGVQFWNDNAYSDYWQANPNYAEHSLGRVYGVQWRDWGGNEETGDGLDQLKLLIDGIKKDPFGRRHIVTAWNTGELDQMCLPPCHMFFQCNVTPNGKLNLLMYQRSCDMFLGVPFDISGYAILMHVIAHQCDLKPGNLVHQMGSIHIYDEHISAVEEQLSRPCLPLPTVYLTATKGCALEDYDVADFTIKGYEPQGRIKAKMVV